MRFKRGSKVEVFCTKEAPVGSWCCAEIIRGNGHNYTVIYADSISSCGGLVLDRVPRKAIRPCPPVVEKSTVWVSGDDVEVFDCFAWKTATVLQVLSGGRYLVRLLGSLHELKVDEHDIRARLCWQGDRWVAIRRGVKNYEELKHNEQSNQKYVPSSVEVNAKANRHLNVKSFAAGITNYTQDRQAVVHRKRKRSSPFCHSARESYARPCQRIRRNEKGSIRVRFVFSQPPPPPEKGRSRRRVACFLRQTMILGHATVCCEAIFAS
ncbi:hypothetical protein Droror1_Dr00015805 [Drosera rotundifolia]